MGEGARDQQGVGGQDDDPGRVLEQTGRQRGRAQLLGQQTGDILRGEQFIRC